MLSVQTGVFAIKKNGSSVALSVFASLHNVEVVDEINVPSMFSFSMNMNTQYGSSSEANLDYFQPGDLINISLGIDQLHPMITGQVTAIEPSFSSSALNVTIRGFDCMYKLDFGTRTKTYENQGDAQIVQDVAQASRVSISVEGNPGKVNGYVIQNNVSNFRFLLSRGEQLNYELLTRGSSLLFRPSAEGNSPVKTLEFPRDIDDINLNLKLPTMGAEVTAIGYDVLTNKVITAIAAKATPSDKMGGSETGYQAADDFPISKVQLECPNISDPRALQEVADAKYQALLKTFIEGTVSVIGDAQLVAGVNIKLQGLSTKFNGTYYVISSTHTYDESAGYKTTIKVRRTGI
ncbi:MAG: hypothetical protein K2P84_05855 [Undibacterium sp.]|nr:hypothetical protein [Undibacterium sp.]